MTFWAKSVVVVFNPESGNGNTVGRRGDKSDEVIMKHRSFREPFKQLAWALFVCGR